MAETFPALVSDLLRADPARPLVTFYDDRSGERTELSVATWANWVAKTASLLVEEFDLTRGDRIHLDLPTHWLGPVFLGAAWTVGLVVVDDPGSTEMIVSGPERLEEHARGGVPVLGCALLPLGVRFPEAVPDGVRDFGVEVWSQPDSFVPWDPPTPDDPALVGRTQRELLTPTAGEEILADGGRLLTTANPASPSGLASFTEPLVRGGSVVWVRHADPARWQEKYDAERATSTWR